jgi:uncharacterized tellurite resistance protein B-like protein
MTLEIKDLSYEEEVVLVGLLKAIIRADHKLSGQEHEEVRRIASSMGQERFAERVGQAQQLFSQLSDIKSYATRITRQGARELIYALLYGLADADGFASEEETLLVWLGEVWELSA